MSLIQMSTSGAVMILAVLLIRFAAVNRLPKKLFILLWEAALLRLLLPFSIPSVFSIYTAVRRVMIRSVIGWNGAVQSAQGTGIPQGAGTALPVPENMASTLLEIEITESAGTLSIWTILWLTGVCICAVFFVIAYLRCRREFEMSLPVHHDFSARWLREHPLRRRVQLRQSDRIKTPLTYGVLKPVILLPKETDWNDSRQLSYVLLHEQIHIRRLDSLRKLVMTAALCIHWFNPFVWLMYILFNRDMELVCDEAVVHACGRRSRSAYARTLISMEERKSPALPLCNSFSRSAVKERVTAVMKTKKMTLWLGIVCVVILAAVVVFLATSADGGRPQETEQMEPESGTPQETEQMEPESGTPQETEQMEPESSAPQEAPEPDAAPLYVGAGFTLNIPEEEWQIYDENMPAPQVMSATYDSETGLWVEHYEETAPDVEARLLEEGYLYDASGSKLQLQSGDFLTEVRIFSGEGDAWTVCSRRLAAAEETEARLDAIAATFAAVPDGQGGGQPETTENAEQAALREMITSFFTACFTEDPDTLRQYFSSSYSGTPETYSVPDGFESLEIRAVKGLDAVAEENGGSCVLSVEFTAPGEDSYTYLTAECVKENGEWKVLSYGLEK